MQGDGEHADLHHADTGYGEAAQIAAILALRLVALRVTMPGLHAIPQRGHGAEHTAQWRCALVQAHIESGPVQVQGGFANPGQAAQGVFDKPGAGRAGHAADQQTGLDQPVLAALGKLPGEARVIVNAVGPVRANRLACRPLRVGGALRVETLQALAGNQARHRLAADTAHGARPTGDLQA